MEDLDFIFEKVEYCAVYDPDTFKVLKVGPSSAFKNDDNKIPVDEEIALDIVTGSILISKCFIDINSKSLELVEQQYAVKIDDIVHRIPEDQWNSVENPEVYLTYYKKDAKLTVQMTSEYAGTKQVASEKTRKIHWSGDTLMNFYITDYNDPHNVYKTITITVNDLINNTVSVENLLEIPQKFSIYTRRLFKGYVLDIK